MINYTLDTVKGLLRTSRGQFTVCGYKTLADPTARHFSCYAP